MINKALLYQAKFLQGWSEAVERSMTKSVKYEGQQEFTIRSVRSIEEIQQQWQSLAAQHIKVSPEFLNYSESVYQEGAIKGLQEVCLYISEKKDIPPQLPGTSKPFTKLESFLWHQALYIGGKSNGLAYAYSVNADLTLIAAKIEDTNEKFSYDIGSMKLGAGPRIYQEGYHAGLKEAVAIIKAIENGESFPLAEEDEVSE